jgi:predicted double-glycine peptidase
MRSLQIHSIPETAGRWSVQGLSRKAGCGAVRRFASAAVLFAFCSLAALAASRGWIDAPFVRQVRQGCGPAAIAMVMQYWARQQPGLDAAAADAEQIDQALPADSSGTSGNELKRYLEAHGFSAYVFDGEPSDLRHHLAKGRPIVVCLGLNGPDAPLHYAVVVGIGDGGMLLNDPARGKLFREKTADFLRAWKATGNWALLALPRQTR